MSDKRCPRSENVLVMMFEKWECFRSDFREVGSRGQPNCGVVVCKIRKDDILPKQNKMAFFFIFF